MLVEPTPHNYLNCRKVRSPMTNVFCNACTSFDYKEKFVEIIYSNLMTAPVGLETDLDSAVEHAETGKQFLLQHEDNFTFGAVAKPLSYLLDESNATTTIDFLSLDVEGAEIEVLKGIDHSKYKFKYICIENRSFEKLTELLEPLGYKFVAQLSGHDFLFAYSV